MQRRISNGCPDAVSGKFPHVTDIAEVPTTLGINLICYRVSAPTTAKTRSFYIQ